MNARLTIGSRLRRDDGFTLTELLASSVLFALVVLTAGSILLGMMTAQHQVSAVAQVTTDGQLAGTAIDTAIRNSTGFRVTDLEGGQFLVAKVAGSGEALDWRCMAWYYSAAGDGSIRQYAAPATGPIAVPDAAALQTWTLLVDGVAPRDGAGIFQADGATLRVAFDAIAADYPPVAIEFASSPLAGVSEDPTCF